MRVEYYKYPYLHETKKIKSDLSLGSHSTNPWTLLKMSVMLKSYHFIEYWETSNAKRKRRERTSSKFFTTVKKHFLQLSQKCPLLKLVSGALCPFLVLLSEALEFFRSAKNTAKRIQPSHMSLSNATCKTKNTSSFLHSHPLFINCFSLLHCSVAPYLLFNDFHNVFTAPISSYKALKSLEENRF